MSYTTADLELDDSQMTNDNLIC